MPYIKLPRRLELDDFMHPKTLGELNYCITQHCLQYADDQPLNYETFNSIVGAIELAKQEFIRRVVNPYEENKISENGDIYHDIEDRVFKL